MARRVSGVHGLARQLRLPLDAEPAIAPPSLERLTALAQSTLAAHEPGVTTPPLKISTRMTRTLGSYSPATGSITLSARLLAFGGYDRCRAILLHELAHAIVHYRDSKAPAHGRAFKAVCRELDVSPARLLKIPADDWNARERYAYECEVCGATVLRKRARRRVRCSCGATLAPDRAARIALSPDGPPVLIEYAELTRGSPWRRTLRHPPPSR